MFDGRVEVCSARRNFLHWTFFFEISKEVRKVQIAACKARTESNRGADVQMMEKWKKAKGVGDQ